MAAYADEIKAKVPGKVYARIEVLCSWAQSGDISGFYSDTVQGLVHPEGVQHGSF